MLRVLRVHEMELRAMGIEHLDLVGSFARDEAGAESDVDLYARFQPGRTPGLFAYVEHRARISGWLQRPVDLLSGPFDNGAFYGALSRDAVEIL